MSGTPIVNARKNATTLGIVVPQSLLILTDQVIP
jgi:hypothetical protein